MDDDQNETPKEEEEVVTTTTALVRPGVMTMEPTVIPTTTTTTPDDDVPSPSTHEEEEEAATTVADHFQCSLCDQVARFEDDETHTIYCSDTCRDKIKCPEKVIFLLCTKQCLETITPPPSTLVGGDSRQMTKTIGERLVYATPEDAATAACCGVNVRILFSQFTPVNYNADLEENEEGFIVFPEDENILVCHEKELCILRVEQGRAEVTLFDYDKKPRVTYNLTATLAHQLIIPDRTYYAIKNREETITLKVSKTLVSCQ